MSDRFFHRSKSLLLMCVTCCATLGCALHRDVEQPTPVYVSSSGDTALDGAMHNWVEHQIAMTRGLEVGSPGPPLQITVGFESNIRVTGQKPNEQAEYRVKYFRDGKVLGRLVGTCDLASLGDCASQIVEGVLEYAHPR
jgi:hypothetical protein